MIDFKEERKIYDVRDELYDELNVNLGFTDFDRAVIIENDGIEEIVPVKQIYFEARPNSSAGVIEAIIKKYADKLGWEFVCVNKLAWVNGLIKYEICFKL